MQLSNDNALIAIALLVFATSTFAQSSDTANRACPSVSVSCASGRTCYEDPYSFRADVSGASPDLTLSYEWTVIGGRIISGQGTPQIAVIGNRSSKVVVYRDGRLVEEMVLDPYTVVVKLTGVPAACGNKTIASISLIVDRPPPIRIVEEFGRVTFQQLKPKLDNFAKALHNAPGATGYIVSEGKWPSQKRAIEYLVETQKLDASRINYVERIKTKKLNVKMFLVPAGATPPK